MVGTTVLHYEVLRELGAGGMGRVYLARDRRTERLVALKFLPDHAAGDPDARDRLAREARASARLSHPGVVTLYGLEETEGHVFLAQEFVDGETLAARLLRGPLDPQETLRLARELSAALAHAHRHGIFHRDLKPSNVLVAADGSFKMADFGIARVEGAPVLTQTGAVYGTLAYLAPERVRGFSGDARADLFALGAILYEAISGRPAFPGRSQAEVMHAVLEEEPIPLAPPPSLSGLVEIVGRLLAKDPRGRPASAEEVERLLTAPSGANTSRDTAQPRRSPRRLVLVSAALVLVALAAAGIAWWMRSRPPATAPDAQPAIAVLYFENVADPDDRARVGSISANLLVTSFAQNPSLHVLGTQRMLEAMRDVGASGAIDRAAALRIARRARAGRIVTGTILRVEPTIVLTAEVADVASGRVLQAERIDGLPGQTVFDVIDLLSARLVPRLARGGDVGITPAPVAQVTSANLAAQAAYAEGLERFAAGELAKAHAAFDAAVGLDPGFSQALYQRAVVEWWLLDGSGAKASLRAAQAHAERLTPRERRLLEAMSRILDNDWPAAQAMFERLTREAPDETFGWSGLVEATFHGGRYEEAVVAARKALEVNPKLALVSSHLSAALTALGRAREAEEAARAALAVQPRSPHLWWSLFNSQVGRGDGRAALATAAAAHEARADTSELAFLATYLAVNLGRPEEARKFEGIETAAGDGRRGFAYLQALREGRFNDAIATSAEAWRHVPRQRIVPFPPVPRATGVEAALEAGDLPRALAWTDSLARRVRSWAGEAVEVTVKLTRVSMLVEGGRGDEAEREIRRLSRGLVQGDDPKIIRYIHARLLAKRGDHAAALDSLAGAVAPAWPGLAPGRRLAFRCRLELETNQPAAALATIDTLLGAPLLDPHEAVRLRLLRGRALERLGRPDEAARSYREFLELWKKADPGRPEVAEARAALARLP